LTVLHDPMTCVGPYVDFRLRVREPGPHAVGLGGIPTQVVTGHHQPAVPSVGGPNFRELFVFFTCSLRTPDGSCRIGATMQKRPPPLAAVNESPLPPGPSVRRAATGRG